VACFLPYPYNLLHYLNLSAGCKTTTLNYGYALRNKFIKQKNRNIFKYKCDDVLLHIMLLGVHIFHNLWCRLNHVVGKAKYSVVLRYMVQRDFSMYPSLIKAHKKCNGVWGSIVVKVLRYKSDGSCGVTWDFFRGSPRRNHVRWGRLSPWKWVPRISPGVKTAVAYGWRPTTLVVLKAKKIRGLNLPGTPWATSACCGMTLKDVTLIR